MTERRCARKGRRLTRTAAAAGKRPAAPARRDRLDEPGYPERDRVMAYAPAPLSEIADVRVRC